MNAVRHVFVVVFLLTDSVSDVIKESIAVLAFYMQIGRVNWDSMGDSVCFRKENSSLHIITNIVMITLIEEI